MRILRRYLLREIGFPLLIWMGFLYLLLLVMQLLKGTDVLLGSAVTLWDFAKLVGFLTPHFVVMAMPIAFLLGILLGIGRMAEDRELVSLWGAGVNPGRILSVPLGMSLFLGGLLWFFAAQMDPWGQSAVRRTVSEIIKKNVIGDVKPKTFYEDIPSLTLYAEEVDKAKGKWTNVLVHDDRDPQAPLLALAREGTIVSAGAGSNLFVELAEGTIHRTEHPAADYTLLTFDQGKLRVGVNDAISRNDRFRANGQSDLTPTELLAEARKARANHEDEKPFLVAFHERMSQAWTPLSFALMGGPLAMGRRQARGRSYFLALTGYVAYYVINRTFENWGMVGRVPPWLGGHGTNILFAFFGLLAFWRLNVRGAVR